MVEHVIALTKLKMGVDLPKEDIVNCHYLPKGGIVLVLGPRRPGTAYHQMVNSIKNPGDSKHINVYFNFMLTRRRNSLLYEIRKLKREGKISQYYTDFDGSIHVKKEVNGKKEKVTGFYDKKDKNHLFLRTFSIQELKETFSK